MHSHNHCECSHEHLRFCKHCKRPYCLDCGKEWNVYVYQYSPYYTYTYPSTGTGTVWSSQTTDPILTTTCSHSN